MSIKRILMVLKHLLSPYHYLIQEVEKGCFIKKERSVANPLGYFGLFSISLSYPYSTIYAHTTNIN